jgi:(2Fe-2S) ferredoxin/signal-transduction protein with cAMP-binding, CBS, and nucleotidyltransferase domain
MIGLDFLRTVEVFTGLDDHQLTAIQNCCVEKEFIFDNKLFGEGEKAAHLWVVIDGQVDLRFDLPGRATAPENTISAATATKLIGWSSFVPPYKYTLSAYCATRNCKVAKIDKASLTRLFEEDPRIGYQVLSRLIQVTGSRFQQMQSPTQASPVSKVKVTVHMSTCGIAAGAREVMTALTEEAAQSGRKDIQVATAGCIGKCNTEPNVTIEIGGTEPIIYQKMNPDKIRQVFQKHVIEGEMQTDFILSENRPA